jgi:histone H2B
MPSARWTNKIYLLLKAEYPDKSVNKKTVGILNNMVDELINRIMSEASSMARRNKRVILSTREIKAACRLVLPPTLASGAIEYANQALLKSFPKTE